MQPIPDGPDMLAGRIDGVIWAFESSIGPVQPLLGMRGQLRCTATRLQA